MASEKDTHIAGAQYQHLTPEQYHICVMKGTEPPFSGKYTDCKEEGVYQCACCGNPLFSSGTKYDSGSGWPSFLMSFLLIAYLSIMTPASGCGGLKLSASNADRIWGMFLRMAHNPLACVIVSILWRWS